MMVKTLYAAVADGAVSRPRCSQNLAVWAHLSWMNLREQLKEVVSRLEITWVDERREIEAEEDNRRQ